MKSDYKAAFNVLIAYWKCIPESERKIVKQKLKLVLGDCYPFLDEHNSPSKPLSQEIHTPPKDCIKRAFKRLKDQCGFGIPD